MKGNKRLFIIIGTAAVIIIAAIWLLSGGNGEPGSGPHGKKKKGGFKHVLETMGLISPEKALSDYQQLSIYPPNSRPLSMENVDLVHPNRRFETPVPIEEGSDVHYVFTADKYRVIGNETVTFTLTAQEGDKQGADRLPLAVEKAEIRKGADPRKAKPAAALNFEPGERNQYLCEFSPAASFPGASKAGKYYASVKYRVKGEVTSALIPFEYFPENTVPARFTGSFSEEIKEGSLYINAEIEVLRKGFYIIDANLFDQDGEPVAYTISKLELSQGRARVPLLFFGKVLVDSKSKAPYVLKNLRGYRFIEVTAPDAELMDREMIREYEKEYATRSYSKSQFSDKEYDSAEKRRRIDFLEKENIEAR